MPKPRRFTYKAFVKNRGYLFFTLFLSCLHFLSAAIDMSKSCVPAEQKYLSEIKYFEFLTQGLFNRFMSEPEESNLTLSRKDAFQEFFRNRKEAVNAQNSRLVELKEKYKEKQSGILKFIKSNRAKVEAETNAAIETQKNLLLTLQKARDEKIAPITHLIEASLPVIEDLKNKKSSSIQTLLSKAMEIDEIDEHLLTAKGREKRRLETLLTQKVLEKEALFENEIQNSTLNLFSKEYEVEQNKKQIAKINQDFEAEGDLIRKRIESISEHQETKLKKIASLAQTELAELGQLKTEIKSLQIDSEKNKTLENEFLAKNMTKLSEIMGDVCSYANLFSTAEHSFMERFGDRSLIQPLTDGTYPKDESCMKKTSTKISEDGVLTLCHGMPLKQLALTPNHLSSYQVCQSYDLSAATVDITKQKKVLWMRTQNNREEVIDTTKDSIDPICKYEDTESTMNTDLGATSAL